MLNLVIVYTFMNYKNKIILTIHYTVLKNPPKEKNNRSHASLFLTLSSYYIDIEIKPHTCLEASEPHT